MELTAAPSWPRLHVISCVLIIMCTVLMVCQPTGADPGSEMKQRLQEALQSIIDRQKTESPVQSTVKYIHKQLNETAQSASGEAMVTDETLNVKINGGDLPVFNVVLELHGSRWGTSSDEVVVVATHHDTPGVDDNSSGIAVLLEVARQLAPCRLVNSIIFVSFDKTEVALIGSRAYILHKLVPEILQKFGISPDTFQGAYILDTIMNYDDEPNSQNKTVIPMLSLLFPELADSIKANDYRGDFLIVMGRDGIDAPLLEHAEKHWKGAEHFIHPDRPDAPLLLKFPLPMIVVNSLSHYGIDMIRGDYRSFWSYTGSYNSYNGTTKSLKAVVFTDTVALRGYMAQCYQKPCDNMEHVTDKRLTFLSITVNRLSNLLREVSLVDPNQCSSSGSSSVIITTVVPSFYFIASFLLWKYSS